ncbi:MAG: hypothetical protein RIM84_14180 [Alphaproteobacteria bacterium]
MSAFSPRRFTFAGAAVDVAANQPEPLDWLAGIVPETAPGPVRLSVELINDDAVHAGLRQRPVPTLVSPVPTFARHRRHVAALDHTFDGGERTLYDPDFDLFYVVGEHRVRIVARRDNLRARLRLLHILREVGLATACQRRALILQAAALIVDGQALLVVGPPRSGKTTLLAHLLRQPGATYLADQLVVLLAQGDGFMAMGVPSIVEVRPDTPRLLGGDLARLVHDADSAFLTPAERAARAVPQPTDDGRLVLTPRQFADAMGAGRAEQAPVVGILLPDTAGPARSRELQRIPVEAAEPRVANAVFRIAFGGAAQSLFAHFAGTGTSASYRSDLTLLQRLVQTVPTFDCSISADAFDDTAGPPLRRERRAQPRAMPS